VVVVALAHAQNLGKLDRCVDILGDEIVDGALVLLADAGRAIFFALVVATGRAGLGGAILARGVEADKTASGFVDVVLASGAAQPAATAALLASGQAMNAAVRVLHATG
jgi:hypothetical protein